MGKASQPTGQKKSNPNCDGEVFSRARQSRACARVRRVRVGGTRRFNVHRLVYLPPSLRR